MSWTDSQSIKVMKYIRDKYNIQIFIETGTYVGVNAQLHSKNFEWVYTCEKVEEYYKKAEKRLDKYDNVLLALCSSSEYLKWSSKYYDNTMIYLDAHFYDPKMPKGRGKFVILNELKSLKGYNGPIVIHDFDNGLGHIVYDGISLDMDLIRSRLKKVNSNFFFYTNELSSCDIVKPDRKSIKQAGLPYDKEVRGNLEYAWKEPRLTYRGILYCLPSKLTKKEMVELGLRKCGKRD